MSLGSLSIALTGTAFWFHLTAIIADRAGGAADEPPGALPRGGNRTTSGAACAAAAWVHVARHASEMRHLLLLSCSGSCCSLAERTGAHTRQDYIPAL